MEASPEKMFPESDESGDDCNLSEDEEEKSVVSHTTQKKAFISIDKILDQIRSEVPENSQILDQIKSNAELQIDDLGTLTQYNTPLPQIIEKKLDG